MEDTTPEIKRKFYEILMTRTEEERFLMCAEMYDSAAAMIFSAMPDDLPESRRISYLYEKMQNEKFPAEISEADLPN